MFIKTAKGFQLFNVEFLYFNSFNTTELTGKGFQGLSDIKYNTATQTPIIFSSA